MAKQIFEKDPLTAFGELISNQLDVEVKFRGREVRVDIGPPATIYLPSIEGASEETIKVMYGLCLHEAGHLRFTSFKVVSEDIKDYLTKMVHNVFEDIYMETRLERDFPDARETLTYSFVNANKLVAEGSPNIIPDRSAPFLTRDCKQVAPEAKAKVVAFIKAQIAAATSNKLVSPETFKNNEETILTVATRLELERLLPLFFLHARQYPLPTHDLVGHPWLPVFQRHIDPMPRNTRQCLDAAKSLIAEMGLAPCLPMDERPIEKARELTRVALELMEQARDAQSAIDEETDRRNAAIKDRQQECFELGQWQEAQDEADEAQEVSKTASKALRKQREHLRDARESERETRQRLVAERKRVRELKKELRDAYGDKEREIKDAIWQLEPRIERNEKLLEEKKVATEGERAKVDTLVSTASAARLILSDKRVAAAKKRGEYQTACDEISRKACAEWTPILKPLQDDLAAKNAAAEKAAGEANEVLSYMKDRDVDAEAQIAPGAVETAMAVTMDENRYDNIENAAAGLAHAEQANQDGNAEGQDYRVAVMNGSTRKYVPFDRSFDEVRLVPPSADSIAEYNKAKSAHRRIIDATTERLRRLRSPERTQVAFQQEEGRLDPRFAYKVAMALDGHNVDISQIRKNVETHPEPKVVVSLLIDCSGSMDTEVVAGGKTRLTLAREAACCLSEVMTSLNIPHEVVGHTTAPERFKNVGQSEDDLAHFSRFIPFQGYLFKSFDDARPARSVFEKIVCSDNVDGEAIVWAANRLGDRDEKTKICIVLSDGLPAAAWSAESELQRHLLQVCKTIEAQEKTGGVYLFGLGIATEAVKHFYKNYDVLKNVDDMPKAVLGIVEYILCNVVGSLG